MLIKGQKGFTLIEMLITLAIIAIVISFASSPDMELSGAKQSFTNTLNNLQVELSTLRNEAMIRSTTTRMVITPDGYVITTYYSATPVTDCSDTGTWVTMVAPHTLSVNPRYEITGPAMSNICFYRDGSSSGGSLILSPITVTSGLKMATMAVIMATGYTDVDIQ